MAALQDKQKRKHLPFYFVALSSLVICFIAAMGVNILTGTLLMMWVCNFFFGAAFSCLPNVLHQNYGLNQLATVHGLLLSAWAVAGLVGNQFAVYVMTTFGLQALYTWLGIFYTLSLVLLIIWSKTCLQTKKIPT